MERLINKKKKEKNFIKLRYVLPFHARNLRISDIGEKDTAINKNHYFKESFLEKVGDTSFYRNPGAE